MTGVAVVDDVITLAASEEFRMCISHLNLEI